MIERILAALVGVFLIGVGIFLFHTDKFLGGLLIFFGAALGSLAFSRKEFE